MVEKKQVFAMREELRGFDLELTPKECAAAKQLAKVLPAPEGVQ
jgi:hypothetical protein